MDPDLTCQLSANIGTTNEIRDRQVVPENVTVSPESSIENASGTVNANTNKTKRVDLSPAGGARLSALLTMAHGGCFVSVGTIILIVRLCGFPIPESQIWFLLLGMAISSGQLAFGKRLLNGVEKENFHMVFDWMVYTAFVQVLPLLCLIVLLLNDPVLNFNWAFNLLGSTLIFIFYCFSLNRVNIYWKELKLRAKQGILTELDILPL